MFIPCKVMAGAKCLSPCKVRAGVMFLPLWGEGRKAGANVCSPLR